MPIYFCRNAINSPVSDASWQREVKRVSWGCWWVATGKQLAFVMLSEFLCNLKCQRKCDVSLNCVSLYMYKWTDADRAQKHGMDEFISSNPCNFDHASLFEMVQRLTLDHRLNDSYSCLASIFFGLQQFKCNNVLKDKIFLYLCVRSSSPHYGASLTIINAFLISWVEIVFLTKERRRSGRKLSVETDPIPQPPYLSVPLFSCYMRNILKRIIKFGTYL